MRLRGTLAIGPLRVLKDAFDTLSSWSTEIPNNFMPRWKPSPVYRGACSGGVGEIIQVDATGADVPVTIEPATDNNKGLAVRVRVVAGANNAIVSVSGNGKMDGVTGGTETVTVAGHFISHGAERGWYSV